MQLSDIWMYLNFLSDTCKKVLNSHLWPLKQLLFTVDRNNLPCLQWFCWLETDALHCSKEEHCLHKTFLWAPTKTNTLQQFLLFKLDAEIVPWRLFSVLHSLKVLLTWRESIFYDTSSLSSRIRRCEYIHRNTFRFWSFRALLVLPGPCYLVL